MRKFTRVNINHGHSKIGNTSGYYNSGLTPQLTNLKFFYCRNCCVIPGHDNTWVPGEGIKNLFEQIRVTQHLLCL